METNEDSTHGIEQELNGETEAVSSKSFEVSPSLFVIAIFCLAVLPDLVNAVFAYVARDQSSQGFLFTHLSLIARSLQVSVPLLLIMKLSQDDWNEHGFRDTNLLADLLLAVIVYFVALWGAYGAYYFFWGLGVDFSQDAGRIDHLFEKPSSFGLGFILLAISSLANGFAEELTMRAYLIPKLQKLTGSTYFAIVTSTALFASYHLYQGITGVVYTIAIGIIFGLFFVITRRFWPLMLAHAAMDFVAFWYSL